MADQPSSPTSLGNLAHVLADFLAASGDRLELGLSGSSTKTRSTRSSIVAASSDIASGPCSSEAKSGSDGVRTQQRVHLARHRAELGKPGQPRAALAVRQRVQRQLPAAASLRDVPPGDAERRLDQLAPVLVPPEQLGHVREAALSEEPKHLELGVGAGAEAPEHLQHGALVVDQRRVGLLTRHRPHELRRVEPVGPGERVELEPPSGEIDDRRLAQQLRDPQPVHGDGERVMELPAVGLANRVGVLTVAGRAQPDRHLVEIVRPGREAHLYDRERERVGQRQRLADAHLDDLAGLGGEPALPHDPCGQRVAVDELQVATRERRGNARGAHASSSASLVSITGPSSRNQKKPSGASVRR